MTQNISINNSDNFVLFNEWSGIRKQRYQDERYFSVVDVIFALTLSKNPTDYLKKLRKRDEELWFYLGTNCPQIEMQTLTGKIRKTLAGNTIHILRLIQSIPSPNAEPLKRRLASLGSERIEEFNNPELWIERSRARAIQIYQNKWMDESWIKKRIQGIEARNMFTDELLMRWIKQWFEYAMITNKTYKIFGEDIDAKDIKKIKNLSKNDNIRDNMTDMEIQLTQITETWAKEIIQKKNARGFNQIGECVDKSVEIIKETREKFEKAIDWQILSTKNNLSNRQKNKRKLKNNEHKLLK